MRRVRVVIRGLTLPGRACGAYTDVHVGLQVGKAHIGMVPADLPDATWETVIDVGEGGVVRGPAVHGPREQRFFYLVWVGRLDGAEPAMFRRAKLVWEGVSVQVLAAAVDSGELHARLALTDKRGMPVCASVRPPAIVWTG
jgi:hypothetical protein